MTLLTAPTRLRHNHIELALHQLSDQPGTPLLMLHGLGESTAPPTSPWSNWPGSIYGLDFTGHGQSDVPMGGGYTCETLLGDVDVALAHIGPAAIVGRGLGAYVGLMAAGARPGLVRGAVLADGPGLAGGGPEPTSATWFRPADADGRAPDPYALHELSRDVRPADYALSFVHLSLAASDLDAPLIVTAHYQPPWLAAVSNEAGVVTESREAAFDRLAAS